MIRIGKRLIAIANFVDKGAVVADVGADHGKLLIHLTELGKIAKGYGIENKSGPFHILERNLYQQKQAELVPILQDGISKLEKDVDTIVLAGLGGETIINILKKGAGNLESIKTIITDSHTSVGEVRRFIVGLGYIIKDETLVEEKMKFYEICKFVRSEQMANYTDFEYRHGPQIIKGPEFRKYAKILIKKMDAVLAKDLPKAMKQLIYEEREILLTYEN